MTWRNMLEEILEVQYGLTPWEIRFAQSISRQTVREGWEPSEKQVETLKRVHGERVDQ